MIKKIFFSVLCIILLNGVCPAQLFSLSDTTITFKNQEGKVLKKEEVQELMKGVFSMKQEVVDGKKIITIIPSEKNERQQQQLAMEAFRAGLIGKPVPAFQLKDINEKTWRSDELKDKVLIINFWFTTCKPCIQEMPHLNELVKQNKDNPVIFIAPAPENETQVKKFLKKYTFDYNIVPASLDYITASKIESFPTHLVIDKNGIIKQVLIGYAADIREKLQAEIDKLLE